MVYRILKILFSGVENVNYKFIIKQKNGRIKYHVTRFEENKCRYKKIKKLGNYSDY